MEEGAFVYFFCVEGILLWDLRDVTSFLQETLLSDLQSGRGLFPNTAALRYVKQTTAQHLISLGFVCSILCLSVFV